MSDESTRMQPGGCDAVVFTAARLQQDHGRTFPHAFLLIVIPPSPEEPFSVWVDTRERLRELIQSSAPRSLSTRTGGEEAGEDPYGLIAYCRGQLH